MIKNFTGIEIFIFYPKAASKIFAKLNILEIETNNEMVGNNKKLQITRKFSKVYHCLQHY